MNLKDKNKEKEAGNGPLRKNLYTLYCLRQSNPESGALDSSLYT